MDKITKSKRGLEVVASHSSGYKISLEKFLHPKITSANLYQPIQDIINYFTCICPFGSGKFEKERNYKKELQKFEYLKNEKSFFGEIKNIFHSF